MTKTKESHGKPSRAEDYDAAPIISNVVSSKPFSFMHISVVLVLIGLAVGGYAVSQLIVRSSHISSLIVEMNQYRSAILNFQVAYDYLPGDIPIPAIGWDDCNKSDDCAGNGNNFVDFPKESTLVVKHLTDTLTLKTTDFSWLSTLSGTESYHPNIISLASRLDGGGYMLMDDFTLTNEHSLNALFLGDVRHSRGDFASPLLTVSETWEIDEKIDDKSPLNGNIRAFNARFEEQGDCIRHTRYVSISNKPTCGLYYLINVIK